MHSPKSGQGVIFGGIVDFVPFSSHLEGCKDAKMQRPTLIVTKVNRIYSIPFKVLKYSESIYFHSNICENLKVIFILACTYNLHFARKLDPKQWGAIHCRLLPVFLQ
jgi:hypothetical protein